MSNYLENKPKREFTKKEKLGMELKRGAKGISNTLKHFGMNLPFDILRTAGINIPVTNWSPTMNEGLDDESISNMTTGEFAKDIIGGGANLVSAELGLGLTGKSLKPVTNYIGKKAQGIKVPFKSKSELNWGQWNSEIDPKIIKQYNKIERQTKRKGTWMKNADGTDFDMMQSRMPKEVSSQMKNELGLSAADLDKHIFVQSKTKNWNKAFGKDPDILFRGQNTYNPKLDQSNTGLGRSEKDKSFINFFTNKYNQGEYYGMGGGVGTNVNSFFVEQNKRVLPFHPNNTSKYALTYDDVLRKSWEGGIPGGVHTVGIPKKINTRVLEGNNERWFNINAPDIERFIDKSVANKKAIWRIDPSKRDHAYNFKQLQNGNSWIIAKPNHIATDDVASYMNLSGADNIRINNIRDGSTWDSVRKGFLEGNMMSPEVNADIYLSKPKSSIKSLLFNNGKFDLKNPNIYKTLLPAVIGGSLYNINKKPDTD